MDHINRPLHTSKYGIEKLRHMTTSQCLHPIRASLATCFEAHGKLRQMVRQINLVYTDDSVENARFATCFGGYSFNLVTIPDQTCCHRASLTPDILKYPDVSSFFPFSTPKTELALRLYTTLYGRVIFDRQPQPG